MATVDLTTDNFTNTLNDNDIVLIDFWADWCGPCKRFSPIFDKVSDQHGDVVFGKIDTEENQELSASLGIQSIPTVMAFKQGNLVFSQPGLMTAGKLNELVDKVREMD